MRMAPKVLLLLTVVLAFAASAQAQESHGGIPDEVFYLMPSFADGVVFFNGAGPARGQLNICALDNSLRFKDDKGQELEASNIDNVTRVRIDTVTFIRYGGIFYRTFPVTADIGIAQRREVVVLHDVKQGAYGTTSQTSAIREYNTFYADGVAYNIGGEKELPYRVTETLFLYKGGLVVALKKKNLRKVFSAHKADIDSYFKEGGTIPQSLPELMSLLSLWAQ